MKAKYGQTIPEILAYKEEKEKNLEKLVHFQEQKDALEKALSGITAELKSACEGQTIPEILAYKEEKEKNLEKLVHFQEQKDALEKALSGITAELKSACEELTQIRKTWAKELEKQIVLGLQDLNLLNVEFEIGIQKEQPA